MEKIFQMTNNTISVVGLFLLLFTVNCLQSNKFSKIIEPSIEEKISRVVIKLKNKDKLKYPLFIEFITTENRNTVSIANTKQNFDTLLKCQTPYTVKLSSEGMYTKKIHYYNENCKDTIIYLMLDSVKWKK